MALLFFGAGVPLAGNTYYIAPDGDDAHPGTIDRPFASFEHAIGLARPGDTIYVRGGAYRLDRRIMITRGGREDQPIRLWAMPGEKPILDFRDNPTPPPNPAVKPVDAANGIQFGNGGDWWHLKGLTIQNAPFYGIRVFGSHNVFERLTLRYNAAAGLELSGDYTDAKRPPGAPTQGDIQHDSAASHNLVLNCDSYLNFDPQRNGEDADGFAAKFSTLGPGNVFRGNRAWSNSDDGYDFWYAGSSVLVEDCWAFDNGFKRPEWAEHAQGKWGGDGLGFKLGQRAEPIVLNRVAAWGNKAFGIDENGNGSAEGVVIRNATLVNNAKNGNPIQIGLDDGRPHTVVNTVAFDVDGAGVTRFDGAVNDRHNTWNGIGVEAGDFRSIDIEALYAAATGARSPEGGLPAIGLRLAEGSSLIDAGVDVGLPFAGPKPDLGAFERVKTGDFNMDGAVNGLDIPGFKQALVNPAGWMATHPGWPPPSRVGDFDGNGAFNGLDIPGFKASIAGSD
jgi:hypothetical protein